MELQLNHIYIGDVLKVLKGLPDKCVHCIVTSPPYWGLRDYGVKGQLGLEKTPQAFIRKLVLVFRECRRVLRDDGTLWLNIGDSYAATGKSRSSEQACRKSKLAGGKGTQISCSKQPNKIIGGLKPKDLVGIPWMLAFALRKDGWYLRQDIIWHKPNPMPESVSDRCTKSHEYIFLLSKSAKYYYDHESIKQPMAAASLDRLSQDIENQSGSDRVPGKTNGKMKAVSMYVGDRKHKNLQTKGQAVHSMHKARVGLCGKGFEGHSGNYDKNGNIIGNGKANKRSVWTVPTAPFKDAHFATFPPELIIDPIKAGCPVGGVVLDPFFGAGTTGLVARKLDRNFIGIELNPKYAALAERRLKKELGLFI
jgi:DNA modification methylase